MPAYLLPTLTTEQRRDAWTEVGAVLSVTWLPFFYVSTEIWFYPPADRSRSFALDAMSMIVTSFSITAIVLFVMYRSNLPWRAYGITRPRIVADLALGVLIWVIAIIVDLSCLAAAGKFVDYGAVYDFTSSTYDFKDPQSTWDKVLFVLLCIAIGVSEEIAMRGYLVPRLEQLLGSAWSAVAISSAFFASYHIYQGFGSVLSIFVSGLTLGSAFILTRRLWPVVIAHAINDMLPR